VAGAERVVLSLEVLASMADDLCGHWIITKMDVRVGRGDGARLCVGYVSWK
jgi:hypothetical protein